MSQEQNAPPNVNIGPTSIAIESSFASLAAIAVVCRFVARCLTEVGWWYDDWAAFLALVWLWILAGLHFAAVGHGLGRHVQYVSKQDQEEIQKLFWWYQLAYVLAPLLVKISALFLYKRVFIKPSFVRLVNIMLCVLTLWGLVSLLVSIFNCTPVQAFWTKHGHCIQLRAWVYGYGIINICLDFIVWLMPIPLIWKLQSTFARRFCLTLIFILGFTDCGVAVARLAVADNTFGVVDFTYELNYPGRLGVIHPSLGIVVVCLPTMRKLITLAAAAMGLSNPFSVAEPSPSDANSHRLNSEAHSYRLKGKDSLHELRSVRKSMPAQETWEGHNNAIALALHGDGTLHDD